MNPALRGTPRREQPAPYLVFVLALNLYAVGALAVSTFFDLSPALTTLIDYADTALCAVFFVDFVLLLVRSPRPWHYLATWGWLDLLSCIPAIDALRWGRTVRIVRVLRVLRGIRATRVLSELILYRRAQSAFLTALLVSLLLIVFAAAATLQFETSREANIRTAEDALWWAISTITTVGYGDKFPLSSEGRLVAGLLMTAGVGLFGTFSGFVAAWFLGAPARPGADPAGLENLRQEVAQLRSEIQQLAARLAPPPEPDP
jgi:voltage-gated potassium channel